MGLKRRETIFDEAGNLETSVQLPTFRRNVPALHGKLKTLKFSDINKKFRELYAYQSKHNAYERPAHMWIGPSELRLFWDE